MQRFAKLVVVLIALSPACDCGDSIDGDGRDGGDPPLPEGEAFIWEIPPPDASMTRLLAIATELGISGDVFEDGAGIRMAQSENAYTGPFSIFFDSGRYRYFGTGFSAPRFEPECGDFSDNDGDGLFDAADPACEEPFDNDETTPGLQLRDDSDAPRLDATVDASGAVTIDDVVFPSWSIALAAGGTVSGTMKLGTATAGQINLAEGTATMSLTLASDITCSGDGCFVGTCTMNWPTLGLTLEYSGDYARGISIPFTSFPSSGFSVTDCSDGGTVEGDVETLLQIPTRSGNFNGLVRFDPPFRTDESTLSIDAADGAVVFSTIAGNSDIARDLPDDETAENVATELLTRLDMLPPEPQVAVVRVDTEDETAEREIDVFFVPTLPLDADNRVEVLGGWVRVRLGTGAAILGLESRWRGVVGDQPFTTAVARAPQTVWEEQGEEDQVDVSTVRVRLHARNRGKYQKFYTPTYSYVSDTTPEYLPLGPVTEFMPLAQLAVPAFNSAVDGASPVTLGASAELGSPPYSFTWSSDVQGPLGTGDSIDAQLSNGHHNISVDVRDDNGAGYQLITTVKVFNSPTARPVSVGSGQLPDLKGTKTNNLVGYKYSWTARPGFVSPAGNMISQFGGRLVHYELNQFRYKMKVNIGGTEYEIISGRCRDVTNDTDNGLACSFPAGNDPPYVIFDEDASQPAKVGRFGASAVAEYERVPGRLTISTKYRAAVAPGVETNFIDKLALKPARPQFRGGHLAVVPQINWEYAPPPAPASDSEREGQCREFGFLSDQRPREGDPDDVGSTNLPPGLDVFDMCRNGATAEITEFELTLYVLAQPDAGSRQYGAWVNDNDSFPIRKHRTKFDNTAGAIDCSRRAFFIPGGGDVFCDVLPFAAERSETLANANGAAATFDNYHAKTTKGALRFVVIPGCNDVMDISTVTALGLRDVKLTPSMLDLSICFHIHERYLADPTFSQDQDITWHAVRRNPAEFNSMKRPDKFVSGEAMRADPLGVSQVLWLESKAESDKCGKSGDVSNKGSPCEALMAPIFPTH